MTDYIKRKDAYMIANDIAMMHATEDTRREYGVADSIAHEILRLPTADVRENVKGEWVLDGQRHRGGIKWCHCSVCGKEENADYAIVQGVNFCPNCGADMRGEA